MKDQDSIAVVKDWRRKASKKRWSYPEFRLRMSEIRRGSGNPFHGRKWSDPELRSSLERLKQTQSRRYSGSGNPMFGRKRTDEERKKISASRVRLGSAKGSRNPNWRGGRSRGRKAEMETTQYKEWRRMVFENDDYTCQWNSCGQRGGDLEADHILPWAYFRSWRYCPWNGRTLCRKHHKLTFKTVKSMRKHAIFVDLDGTLAFFDKWRGKDHIGPPVPEMMKRVRKWIADGRVVKIFTARAAEKENIPPIERWLAKQGLPELEITAKKDESMGEMWDDRAVQVKRNTGKIVKDKAIGIALR